MTNTAPPNWARFAPGLASLAERLEPFQAVICGCTSYPQPVNPTEPESLAIQPDDPRQPDLWVTITADGCTWFEDGELWECSHSELFAYLEQLPRQLYTFGRYVR